MRLHILILPIALLLLLADSASAQGEKTVKTIEVKRVTAVLLAEEIEPCLNFWVDRLGFSKTAEVPDGNKLGFVILQKGTTEVMYQTFASVEKDDAQAGKDARKGPTFLYLEVDDLEAVIAALKGVPLVMPVRTTFYGAREIGVKDPAGHFVTFAQYGAAAQH
ncbi:MAG TPA: VOC family protein [Candidatus Binatus sp.]|jgi:uncharacterized glyoxalase superfamily protein PhnB|nr:VOC family protein [Candidatus Binatus sp.]